MKAVILAAGAGKRMGKLTWSKPKPLLEIREEPLIDHILESLPSEVDEVIIVVDYLGDQIKDYVSRKKYVNSRDKFLKIKFTQGSDVGNAYSFMATRKYLKDERFLLIYGDEIPTGNNMKKCLDKPLSILVYGDGIYDGVMVLNTDIFGYELTDNLFRTLVEQFVKDHEVSLVKAEKFIGGINTPSDLARVEKEMDEIYPRKHYEN